MIFRFTTAERAEIRRVNLEEFRAKKSAETLCNSRRPSYGCRCGLLKNHRGLCQCPRHGEYWYKLTEGSK
jgi:hypothetical protein